MHPLIASNRNRIADLCRLHHVRRLDVFGSAARASFDPATSDVDFLVEFEPLAPVAYKRGYFDLLWGLEELLGRPVDLVTVPSLRNPYFMRNVYDTRELVYGG